MTPPQFRSALDKLGLSQAEFSILLGVDARSVRRWETGERKVHPFVVILLQLMLANYIEPTDITDARELPREKQPHNIQKRHQR